MVCDGPCSLGSGAYPRTLLGLDIRKACLQEEYLCHTMPLSNGLLCPLYLVYVNVIETLSILEIIINNVSKKQR